MELKTFDLKIHHESEIIEELNSGLLKLRGLGLGIEFITHEYTHEHTAGKLANNPHVINHYPVMPSKFEVRVWETTEELQKRIDEVIAIWQTRREVEASLFSKLQIKFESYFQTSETTN
jgi:hypothetical protein